MTWHLDPAGLLDDLEASIAVARDDWTVGQRLPRTWKRPLFTACAAPHPATWHAGSRWHCSRSVGHRGRHASLRSCEGRHVVRATWTGGLSWIDRLGGMLRLPVTVDPRLDPDEVRLAPQSDHALSPQALAASRRRLARHLLADLPVGGGERNAFGVPISPGP